MFHTVITKNLSLNQSPSPHKRHIRRHHCVEQHVRVQRQTGHVDDRLADDVDIHQGFDLDVAIGLQDACGHAGGHFCGGVADVDLTDRYVVFTAIQAGSFGHTAHAVLGGCVGDRVGARGGG